MSPRRRRLDYALRARQRGIWIATVVILLLGGVAVFLATSPGERGRMRVLDRIEVGDSAQRVVQLLGPPPRTCSTGSLAHLRTQFPPGWSPAALEQGLEQLRQQTTQRWIYPLDLRRAGEFGCAPRRGVTELGFDRQQRVLWYVPITGKRAVELPVGLTPESVDLPHEQTDG